MNVSTRGVNDHVFQKFKSEIIRQRLKVGEGLNQAMLCWLKHRTAVKKRLKISDLKPKDFGVKTDAAQDLDKILYGDA